MKYALRHRWACVLITLGVVVVSGVSAFFWRLPLLENDKPDAVRKLVAWIVEDATIPGFGERYPDAKFVPDRKRFLFTCDTIPNEASVSYDPRVVRVTPKDFEAAMDDVGLETGFGGTVYIGVALVSENEKEIVLEFAIISGPLGGHGYRFTFYRTVQGLRASGKMLWVS